MTLDDAYLIAIEGPDCGGCFPLGDFTTVGSASDAKISLSDRRVARWAVEIRRDAGLTRFRNLDPLRRLIVNGQVVEEGNLQYGDWLALGGSTLVYAVESRARTETVDLWADAEDSFEIRSTHPPFSDTRQLLESLPRVPGSDQRLFNLYKVCLELSRLQDLAVIARRVLDFALEFFPAERAFLLVTAAEGSRPLRLVAARGADPQQHVGREHFCRSVARETVRRQESLLSSNPRSDARFKPGDSVFELGISSILCAPMLRDRKLLGMIQLTTSDESSGFGTDDLELLTAIACTAAIAVENGLTRQKLGEQTRNLYFLSRASKALSSILSREHIIREGVRRACSIMACTKGSLIIEVGGRLELAFAVGMERGLVDQLRGHELEARRVREVLRSNEPLHVINRKRELSSDEHNLRYHTGSFVIVPVCDASHEPFAALCMTDKLNGSPFQGIDVELLSVFANQMGTALDNARLYERAITDPLTGLHVRHHFDLSLEDQMELSVAEPLAIALLDLDDFKLVNDTWGHQVGDDVLRVFGARLKRAVRPGDMTARYGGEEFAILMPGAGRKVAQRVAERIRLAVSKAAIQTRVGELKITLSVGVCVRQPDESASSLLARADKALYSAKGQGKDRVVFAEGLARPASGFVGPAGES